MKARTIAEYGLLLALALVLSYVELLLPLSFAVPGIKLGLANLVVIFALYRLGWGSAAVLSLLRVLLVSLLFGNAYSLAYSLAGAVLSLLVMLPLQRCGKFRPLSVSAAGGVMHNVGQILAATVLMETGKLLYYLPVLCVSGVVAGCCIGITAGLLVQKVPHDKR